MLVDRVFGSTFFHFHDTKSPTKHFIHFLNGNSKDDNIGITVNILGITVETQRLEILALRAEVERSVATKLIATSLLHCLACAKIKETS